MKDPNCIFCKIANGEIPSRTLYEDEKFRVIMDLGPATRGHSLILPKEHYANLYEIPEDLAADAAKLAKKLAIRMTEKLGADGFNIIQNNNEAAGQTVLHYHVHLIPRYQNDGQHILWNPGELPAEEMDEILNTILAD
ncbi:MAG: HIT domain-containing protein [Lachnospiraceae bacterium]|nr:HIT domain-containing protein [Lachnospiraceae bacterium]